MMDIYDKIQAEQETINNQAAVVVDATTALLESIKTTYGDHALITATAVDLSNDANVLLALVEGNPANIPPLPHRQRRSE